ncbi:hypothetical protein QU481_09205 [Crenobacter sp. SG2303]|uniref:Membrane-associated oxidoreductase n=1 Tax=Crenobacter oryzisoli TaxID=3056844 RepID=A0ABT7XMS6_9NEIS|nr:hypothetical protein [Crenobacter sp. SG2303]MDN0075070.1 hypothetical protein [Crenobacter sp. SG2303]
MWKQVCEGREADLIRTYNGLNNPHNAGRWPNTRDLRQRFLETILLHEPYRSAIPRGGVKIRGARFREPINLENAHVTFDLALLKSRFDSDLKLAGFETDHSLSLAGSMIAGELSLQSAHIERNFITSDAKLSSIKLLLLKIDGILLMEMASVTGDADMNAIIAKDAQVVDTQFFKDVKIQEAEIGGDFNMQRSTVIGNFDLTSSQIGDSLLLWQITLRKPATLHYVSIGGNLDLSGSAHLKNSGECKDPECLRSSLNSIDLTGAKIGQALRFGSRDRRPPHWDPGATLILRNVAARDLQIQNENPAQWNPTREPLPDYLDLSGFTYNHLSALDVDPKYTVTENQDVSWWLEHWFKHLCSKPSPVPFTLQPYEQLGAVLSNLGQKEKADDILYEGKNCELSVAPLSRNTIIWMGMQKILIGYGYRIYYAWAWIFIFITLGVMVLRLSGEGKRNGLPYGVAYTIDTLLPIVHLREAHYKIDLNGWARYYFYLHKVMGYVLASFLIAGLSGLTK